MARYVVDACVAVKWYVPEVASDRAVAILKGGHELLAPELILSEFGNIIWKKVSRGSLSAPEGGEILDAFLGTRPVECYPVEPYVRAAFDIATRYRCTVYEALYLAVAIAEDGLLVTADERFAYALQNTPVAGYVSLL